MAVSRKQKHSNQMKRKAFLAILICAIVLLVSFLGFSVRHLTYNKVYSGVYINNVDVSGLTKEELITKIPEIFDMRLSKELTLKIGSSEVTFDSLTLSPVLNCNAMADSCFNYGRTKNIFGRIGEINSLKKNPVSVPFMLEFDNSAILDLINKASQNLEITAVENKIEFGDNSLIITKGKSGNGVLFNDVKDSITECLLSDKTVATANLKYIEPEEINYDYITRYVSDKPVSASYTIENHRINFSESKPAVSLKKSNVESAITNSTGNKIVIPAQITQPDVTSESLRSTLLADELGKYSTDYSSSSNDRAYNIKLACEKINGYVLAPGEEFSYNEVVGPRTAERGFRIANVYVGNTVQPGIGGGICQVSSTLFNAVVFADLEITERKNHSLPVSYVPMGRDATVSYGAIDFKFKNNTKMPIEIKAIAEGRTNTIIICGTDEFPEREIKITTQMTGSSSPKVVTKEDPNLPEGEVKVESAGSNGSSYVTYKVVYENGAHVSSNVLTKSTYRPKDRVEIIGTKKIEAEPELPPADVPLTPESPVEPKPSEEEIAPAE